jgi:hypothetical protein
MASRPEIPLIGKIFQATGDILLRAELDLAILTRAQTWERVLFRFDSAGEMTTMPAAQARLLDIPLPAKAVPGLKHAQTGLEVRAGVIRARVVGLDGTRDEVSVVGHCAGMTSEKRVWITRCSALRKVDNEK